MTTYAVGDLQGCLQPLKRLLEQVDFNPEKDILWCTGDLVNRGPESLAALRFIYALGDACITVLGNHDLHLLAVAYGFAQCSKGDTLEEILSAPDKDDLLHWLRHRPLLHHEHGYTLVHAGIAPQWSLKEARSLANEVEAALRAENFTDFLANMYGNKPAKWKPTLSGHDRLRLITNYFTRMRFCTAKGKLDFKNKHTVDQAAAGTMPWFSVPDRAMADQRIIFGHWAALQGKSHTKNTYALDTGCVWGNKMTMMRLDDQSLFHTDCSTIKHRL